jgi:hypothetical protein
MSSIKTIHTLPVPGPRARPPPARAPQPLPGKNRGTGVNDALRLATQLSQAAAQELLKVPKDFRQSPFRSRCHCQSAASATAKRSYNAPTVRNPRKTTKLFPCRDTHSITRFNMYGLTNLKISFDKLQLCGRKYQSLLPERASASGLQDTIRRGLRAVSCVWYFQG